MTPKAPKSQSRISIHGTDLHYTCSLQEKNSEMETEAPEVLCNWSARKVPPIVILYVAGVFAGFILIAFFVLHSMTAVKALAMTAVGALVPLVPTVLQMVEYRLNGQEVESRPLNKNDPKPYERLFRLNQLSHIVPTKRGFKYYRPLKEKNPLRRFWKLHISDGFSGEVHVERADLAQVLDTLAQQGIPIR